jgi:hypothetical protein
LFDWLPDVCRELRGNLLDIYWTLLPVYVVFLICLEFFKIPDANIQAGKIIKRAVISMILLYSFEECMNVLAMISDGVTEKISGVIQLKELLKHLGDVYESKEINWLHYREAVLYIVSLFSYIVAYLGVFVADVLVHFVWSILYVVSPLMILMYVSDKTAFVTSNLYKGLISVITWKIFWEILGVLLLKLATAPEATANTENFLSAVLINLMIGFCMLFIPFATKSLVTTGFESAATAFAAVPAAAAAGAIKLYALKYGKKALKEPLTGFKGTRNLTQLGLNHAKTGMQKGKEFALKSTSTAQSVHQKLRTYGVSDAQKMQSPFGKSSPFTKGKARERILNGKE